MSTISKVSASVREVDTYSGMRRVEAHVNDCLVAVDFKESNGKWLPSSTLALYGVPPSASVLSALEGLAMFLLNGRMQ
jgi:hypothetical protein